MRLLCCCLGLSTLLLWSGKAAATNRYFGDISVRSPNGRYLAEARSPDNKPGPWQKPFQANFVYTCTDTKTEKLLWTRKQPMREPEPIGDSGAKYAFPSEASPVRMYVSDAGWTVIVTGWYELLAVDPQGRDTCKINLLLEAMTEKERESFVHDTTAGPMWTGCSLWYFLDVPGQRLFVVRPWWGRRILVDIEKGELATETKAVSQAIAAYERDYVMRLLERGAKTRKSWENSECCEAVFPVGDAAYLAGPLQIRDAIPLLQQLEESTYSGSSTGYFRSNDGHVDPTNYSTLTLRQIAQLSLRRLGETPKASPPIVFAVPHAANQRVRADIEKIEDGMEPEQVLSLLGGPDFVVHQTRDMLYDRWEYDMDASPPFTLIVKWRARHVVGIEIESPPSWKDGFTRDEQITLFR